VVTSTASIAPVLVGLFRFIGPSFVARAFVTVTRSWQGRFTRRSQAVWLAPVGLEKCRPARHDALGVRCSGAMTEGTTLMRKLAIVGVALSTITLAIPSAASAGAGPPVDRFTEVVAGTDVIAFASPCGGGPGTASLVFHDVFHVTAFADGNIVLHGNQSGTFSFVPDDPDAPSSSGRYRNGFTARLTANTETDTSVFTVVGRDSEGQHLRFQVRSHFTFANGELRVDHSAVSCS
jgi:hypothetical protein